VSALRSWHPMCLCLDAICAHACHVRRYSTLDAILSTGEAFSASPADPGTVVGGMSEASESIAAALSGGLATQELLERSDFLALLLAKMAATAFCIGSGKPSSMHPGARTCPTS
jgi:hypothetical protein